MSASPYVGVILRRRESSRKDILISAINSDGSLIDVLCKNVRSSSSKFQSTLQEGNKVSYLCISGYSIPVLKDASLLLSSENWRLSYDSLTNLYLILELCHKYSKLGENNLGLFQILESILTGHTFANLSTLIFFIESTIFEGYLSRDIDKVDKLFLNSPAKNIFISLLNQDYTAVDVADLQTPQFIFMIKSLITYIEEISGITLESKKLL